MPPGAARNATVPVQTRAEQQARVPLADISRAGELAQEQGILPAFYAVFNVIDYQANAVYTKVIAIVTLTMILRDFIGILEGYLFMAASLSLNMKLPVEKKSAFSVIQFIADALLIFAHIMLFRMVTHPELWNNIFGIERGLFVIAWWIHIALFDKEKTTDPMAQAFAELAFMLAIPYTMPLMFSTDLVTLATDFFAPLLQ